MSPPDLRPAESKTRNVLSSYIKRVKLIVEKPTRWVAPKKVKITILRDARAIGHHKDIKAGDVLEVGQRFAKELVDNGGATFLENTLDFGALSAVFEGAEEG